jgi:cell division protease FtsH
MKGAVCMSCFDLVCGYEDIKAELIRIHDVLRHKEKYETMGVKRPRGILLCGDSGLGKTRMAECFIGEWIFPTFEINKEKPGCDVITEIREAFAKAKEAGEQAIVFIDNLDDDADDNIYAVLRACMDACREDDVFVLATAKDKDNIPDYLLRPGRFDKVIEVVPPTVEDEIEILNFYLALKECASDVDVEEIAGIMRGNSCADLEMVVNEAAVYAGRACRDTITQQDLIKACISLLFASPEKADTGKERDLLEVCVHEAGHVVVAEVLEAGCVAITSVRSHAGGFAGITCVNYDENNGRHMKRMERNVIRSLAGKAASEIVLGMVDVGCADDLAVAFRRVERLVDNLCAFGFEAYEGPNSSETLKAKKEQLIAEKMAVYYQTAKQLLAENRAFLDKVTEELMCRKTLRQKDIKKLRAKGKAKYC